MNTNFADEVITVASGTTYTLDSTLIDGEGSGGSRASKATLFVHDIANSEVGYRFGEDDPVEADYTFIQVEPNTSFTVEGYDNLVNLKLVLIGSVTAKVFVVYES